MAFDRVKYLQWAHRKPEVHCDLSTSAVENTLPEDVRFDWRGILFSGPNQNGYKPLLEAVAARYGVDAGNVATACGASMANFLVCAALLRTGDEVIVEKPCYGPLLDLPVALGARVRRLTRRFRDAYGIDLRELERLVTRRTRLVILTNLHNPSGVRIPQEVLEQIGEIARRTRTHVLVDEIYLEFLFDDTPPSCFRINDWFISTSSLTKVYGLDGLRCGWILAGEELIRRIRDVRDYVDANGPFPAEMIAARLFPMLPRILARARATVETNFPMVRRFVESHPELSWVPPDGGIICFPRHRSAATLTATLKRLAEDYDTLVVPGRFFEARSHFRLGFGAPAPVLRIGLQRLARALLA